VALLPNRRIEGDWFDAPVPDSVEVHPETHLETAFCFCPTEGAVEIARGAHVYAGTLFDVAPGGRIRVGECSMLNGVHLICDNEIEIGAYAAISWNVVFMDSYRMPVAPEQRRHALEARARDRWNRPCVNVPSRPVRLHDNVWIGFDVCVLPGVTIGEGSVVGARSVVVEDVPAYTIVAGNPARVIRSLPRPASGAPRP
jgi:acetyltransferase-like isoleucine patch superfamily enzyme